MHIFRALVLGGSNDIFDNCRRFHYVFEKNNVETAVFVFIVWRIKVIFGQWRG
jgi:hypothetical protein